METMMQTMMKKDEDQGEEDDTYEDYGDEDDGDDTNDDSYQWQTPMADVAVIKRRRWQEDINVGNGVDQYAHSGP